VTTQVRNTRSAAFDRGRTSSERSHWAGQHLGLIPTPRRAITLAFSGPDKRMLYVPQMGAVGPDGQTWETPEGIRNTAMTIFRIPMQAQGFLGRPK